MGHKFVLISEDSVLATYGILQEDAKLYVHFNKELKTIHTDFQVFERKHGDVWAVQDINNHSCKNGYWRTRVPELTLAQLHEIVAIGERLFTQEAPCLSKYRCTQKCPELDYEGLPHCTCVDPRNAFSDYPGCCPVGNVPIWESTNSE